MGRKKTRKKVEASLQRRRRREYLFRGFGMLATGVGILFLALVFVSLIAEGSSAFRQTYIQLEFDLARERLAPNGRLDLAYADFDGVVREAMGRRFPDARDRGARRELNRIVSIGASYQLHDLLEANPDLLGAVQTLWKSDGSTSP